MKKKRQHREAEIQSGCLQMLRLRGFFASVTDASRSWGKDGIPRRSKVEPGWPDITAVQPRSSRAFLFEVKVPGGHLSPIQERLHLRMRRAGINVFVVHSVAELNNILDIIIGHWEGYRHDRPSPKLRNS